MDSRHPVYDTTILGLVAIIVFVLTLLVVNDSCAMRILDWFKKFLTAGPNGASEAIALLTIVGGFAIALGSIIQVVSILIFRVLIDGDYYGGVGRKVLAHKIKVQAHKRRLPDELQCAIQESDIDALFAWVHYSDPRERLIDWGRMKLRYVYLAENWMVAFGTGFIMALLVSLSSHMAENGPTTSPMVWWANYSVHDSVKWFVAIVGGLALVLIIWGLYQLRDANRKADQDMIAAYVAGTICPNFKKDFLPSLKESADHDQNAKSIIVKK